MSQEMNFLQSIQKPQQQQHSSQSCSSTGTFSIATPAVTTIIPLTENMTDASLMLPSLSYGNQNTYHSMTNVTSNDHNHPPPPQSMSAPRQVEEDSGKINANNNNKQPTTFDPDTNQPRAEFIYTNNKSSSGEPGTGSYQYTEMSSANLAGQDNKASLNAQQVPTTQQTSHQQSDTSSNANEDSSSNNSKLTKKRNKATRKSTKLDAKSKLEKSRQSARECRARKKLRYQYLEDLVCNREKAVVKLREELTMFCELSKQIDSGTISDKEAKLLVDQTKENNRNDSTSIL